MPAARKVPGGPGEEGPPPYEVLAALAASLRRELAGAAAALEQARADLVQARERIAELEARLSRTRGTPPSRHRVKGWPSRHRGGARIAAVIVYLYAGQFLSKERTALALAELFGIPCSSGTVAALTARAAGRLDGFLEQVRQGIAASDAAGFDETGFRVEGRLAWVHCARTGKYTLLAVHPRRGRQAIEAMGILPSFTGIAVHDAWAPYDTYTPLTTSFAVLTPCASCRPSPMPRQQANGAGPRRPPTRSPGYSSSSARRSARGGPPRTQPRWPLRSTSCAPPP